MSEMQRRMDSSGLTPFPNLDTTSILGIERRPMSLEQQQTWTAWEGGLLLLVIDWYSGGESVASQCKALWIAHEDRISVQSVFSNWAVFLDNQVNGLEPSEVLTQGLQYFIENVDRCWRRLQNIKFREHAVIALFQNILPLTETLEAEFDVKICYIKHNKLPGLHDQTYGVHVNDGTWGQYKVHFPRLYLANFPALELWHILAEKRKERERLYNLAIRQTNHVLGLGLPVVDLWDPGLQEVFGVIRRETETETETEMETNTNRARQSSELANAHLS
ncbi:hypothetical protein BTUL_0031g00600 [Botrytis tulipae]|uniref:Uncharacterized protein n=1 Tax=Botrytis tulipae TaxID=87230 RepID=A0A4Z1EUR6_9HELO|nr:hypothetical protein BTUL_0031g00600 [Botrytis tulipae]